MGRVRVFWCAQGLLDYRFRFALLMHKEFEVELFIGIPDQYPNYHSEIPVELNHTYGKARIWFRGINLELLTYYDLQTLLRAVVQSDVFLSSYVWNSYTLVGLLLSKLLKKKVILHEEINVASPQLRFRLQYTIMRILWRYADAFLVMAEAQKTFLMDCGVDPEKIFVSNEYPGYVYSQVEPHEIKIPFAREVRVVLYIGRLIEFKGVDYLIRAFSAIEKRSKNVALLIVGNGPLRERLMNLSKDLAIKNIHFAGYVPGGAAVKSFLLKRSCMVIVPSIVTKNNIHEAGPLVVLEALSAGRPVVCTNACPHKCFIQDGLNGWVVPQKNVNALIESICYLLDDKQISQQQVLASFYKIKTHDDQFEQCRKAIHYVLQDRVKAVWRRRCL